MSSPKGLIAALSQGLPHYTHLLGLHAARTALDNGQHEIAIDHVQIAIGKAVDDSHASLRSDFRKAVTSAQANIFGDVLLACALSPTDEFGYFSPGAVREPLSRIRGKEYDIPSFSKHLKSFSTITRGRILEKSGPKYRTKYRFSAALMPPLIIMNGLVEKKLDTEMLQDLQAETSEEAVIDRSGSY